MGSILYVLSSPVASPTAQQVKNPCSVQEAQETCIQSLGQTDPLEKEIATHSSILPGILSFLALGYFTMSQFFLSGDQSIGASAVVLKMVTQD